MQLSEKEEICIICEVERAHRGEREPGLSGLEDLPDFGEGAGELGEQVRVLRLDAKQLKWEREGA